MNKFLIINLITLIFIADIKTISNVRGIVFAAGKSTRFGSSNSKLVTKIKEKPLILYPVEALCAYNIPVTLVVNFQQEQIKHIINAANLDNVTFVEQETKKGTGAALAYSRKYWNTEHILAINGDMVILDKTIIQRLYDEHIQTNADISFVTAYTPDEPLARVIVDEQGTRIIEIKHFTGDLRQHPYSNVGIYIFKRTFLEKYIDTIELNPNTNEYYVTSLIEIANNNKHIIKTINVPFDTVRGVNTQQELHAAEQVVS